MFRSCLMTRENLLNAFGLSWSLAVIEEYLTLVLTVVTGVTLIWMNIERALKARHTRQKNNIDD